MTRRLLLKGSRAPAANDSHTLLDVRTVHGIDQPHAALDHQRVRAALHELVHDPAEAGVELVARADRQRRHVAA